MQRNFNIFEKETVEASRKHPVLHPARETAGTASEFQKGF